jgi:folate-binding protein YgfZ
MATYICIENRGVIQIAGKDRLALLQGLVTQDVFKVHEKPLYGAMLSAQGRFLHDFLMVEKEDVLYLTPERERKEDLARTLNFYKLRSDAQITILNDWAVFAIFGSEGIKEEGALIFQDPRLLDLGNIIMGNNTQMQNFFLRQDLKEAPRAWYDQLRISLGIPDGSLDMEVEKAILLEYGIDDLQGLDWKKGCYIGQELMARTKHLGVIRKRLLPMEILEGIPVFGENILVQNEAIGKIKSVGSKHTLGLVRLGETKEFLRHGKYLETESGAKIKPFIPRWMKIDLKGDEALMLS